MKTKIPCPECQQEKNHSEACKFGQLETAVQNLMENVITSSEIKALSNKDKSARPMNIFTTDLAILQVLKLLNREYLTK